MSGTLDSGPFFLRREDKSDRSTRSSKCENGSPRAITTHRCGTKWIRSACQPEHVELQVRKVGTPTPILIQQSMLHHQFGQELALSLELPVSRLVSGPCHVRVAFAFPCQSARVGRCSRSGLVFASMIWRHRPFGEVPLPLTVWGRLSACARGPFIFPRHQPTG